MNGTQLPRLDNLENYYLSDKLWGDSCCSTFSYFYFHNIASNKTNIGNMHQIAGLELSECDKERF
jgi:hypothetical protein